MGPRGLEMHLDDHHHHHLDHHHRSIAKMSSYPTPPPPPPPPPFSPQPLHLPAGPQYPAGGASPSSSSGLQPPPPAPGIAPYLPSPSPSAYQAAPAPSPFPIALPGGGQPSSSVSTPGAGFTAGPLGHPPSAGGGGIAFPMGTAAAAATAGNVILPLGPPPLGAGKKGGAGGGARGAGGRARQGKSASVDPGQGDDDLLPPPSAAGGPDGARDAEEDADEEDAELEDGDGDEMESMEARQRARGENMPYLVEAMTPEQLDRHDVFRRHGVNRGAVKRLMNQVLSQSVSDQVALVAAGATKIFIGEMVERARQVQAAQAGVDSSSSDLGPLRPEHIQEAYRLYTLERDRPGRFPPAGGAPGVGRRRRLF